jgi:uncharacterized protein (TIGR03435 family)
MLPQILCFALIPFFAAQTPAPTRPTFDTFEVATIKQVDPDAKAGRYITMQGDHRFIEKSYTLKLLIAAAYDLNPRAVSGGPAWIDSTRYDITAITPGDTRPSHDQQMSMLRTLLSDRFKLTFHREQKEFSLYELQLAKGGSKLKPSQSPPDDAAKLISTVYPDHLLMPARNATMADFVSILQRAILDRPVVDKTSLPGKFDFDLTWAPDESQFGGAIPAPADAAYPNFFTAVQQQLGLKLEPTKGPIAALVVDTAEHPTAD